MCSTLRIRLAKDEDQEDINSSFLQHFLQTEPMNVYLKDYKPAAPSDSEHAPDFGLTLVAEVIESEDQCKLAGFLICKVCERGTASESNTSFMLEEDRAGFEISRLLKELNDEFDVFRMYDVQEAVDLVILGTVPEYRGRSIGFKLCEAAIDLVRVRGYKVIFMDCTSSYSAAIARKCGMECIGEISYDDYQKKLGERLFVVNSVHTHVRRFVKILNQ